ncbi:hypothetical protein [Reyranella sp.]|uniref:hypothetical protein n=1 Tax=Reyranella sp. TaxID=1929291 RepID=UPI003BACB1AF
MTTVVLGSGPKAAWARAVLGRLSIGGSDIRAVEGGFSRASLDDVASSPVDALVLVDQVVDVGALAKPSEKVLCDLVRPNAMQFAFAREVAARARCTIQLAPGAPVEEWATALADLTGTSPDAVREHMSGFPGPTTASLNGLPEGPVANVVRGYLAPLSAACATAAPLSLNWQRELFLDGDAPGTMLPAAPEVGGRPRILAYGPYLPLPVGRWSATVYLGFSNEIGRLPFIFEVDAGGSVARGFFEVERGGLFSLSLDFEVAQPLHLVECRLISQDSAIEGQFSLIEVQLDLQPGEAPAGYRAP